MKLIAIQIFLGLNIKGFISIAIEKLSRMLAIKLLKVAILTLLILVVAYQVFVTTRSYLSFPTVVASNFVDQTKATLPDVTVCYQKSDGVSHFLKIN